MTDAAPLGELVTVTSASGLELDGILYRSGSSRTTIVHVHGSFGNFYQGRLLKVMASAYVGAGLNLLSVNMASHDGMAEGSWRNGEFAYIGGAVASFDECTNDITGIVAFASHFSDRIILQGHSLGCDRVLQFSIERKAKHDIVLLAPCDSYQLQDNWITPETVESQVARLKRDARHDVSLDWLPPREYGIKGNEADWTYTIPVTRRAFLSIAEGAPYRLIKVKQPADFQLDQRALILIGGNDALQVWPHDTMFDYFRRRINSVEGVVLPSGDHMFASWEAKVAAIVIAWARQTGPG